MKWTALFLLGLVMSCSPQHNSSESKYLYLKTVVDNLRVGGEFLQDRDHVVLIESSTEYQKYRIYDPRPGQPWYWYVTVKADKVVAIWRGGNG